MTDRELRCRCFEAIDFQGTVDEYNPLTDDAQAMALVKKFEMSIDFCFLEKGNGRCGWHVTHSDGDDIYSSEDADLNRAICECVAKLL